MGAHIRSIARTEQTDSALHQRNPQLLHHDQLTVWLEFEYTYIERIQRSSQSISLPKKMAMSLALVLSLCLLHSAIIGALASHLRSSNSPAGAVRWEYLPAAAPGNSAHQERGPMRLLPGGGRGGSKHLLALAPQLAQGDAVQQQEGKVTEQELAARRMLPGGGRGGSKHLLATTTLTSQQADTELSARRMLTGGGRGGSRHLLTSAPTSQQQQADTELGARRMLPGGGRGGSRHMLTSTALSSQQQQQHQQADTEMGARRMLPGGGRGDRGKHL
jgi:hypothetical protein